MYSTENGGNDEYITDFKKKAELFLSFFPSQCSLMNSNSQLSPTLFYKKNERLSSVKFTVDDTFKIMSKLDPNKAPVYDKIGICMRKICSTFICKPLRLFSITA